MTIKKKDIIPLQIRYLRGPNIWTYRPVIEVILDIGELEDFPSNKIEGLYERLTAALPGLSQHRCGIGEIGGFLERLKEGTWAGHILEHVVLEIQNRAGMKTGFGQTRSTHDVGVYKMAFRTRQEQVGKTALTIGRDLLMAMIHNHPFNLASKIAELTEMVDALCLGPSTGNIVDAAIDRKIPFIRLTDGNLVQLGHGAAQRRIWTAETDRTSAIAESIASDKDMTKSLLKACGVPVPDGEIVTSPEEAWELAQDIGVPVALKPYDGNHGRGVSLNLMTQEDVIEAYHIAARKGDSKKVIVERYITGNEHRLLVVGNQVVAAAKGEALWVSGNGTSTVVELVDDQINIDPRRGETEEFPLNTVKPHQNAEIILELKRQNLEPFSIPAKGKKILIQTNGNVANDVTDEIHPEVARVAALAARIVGLDIAGIDLVVDDISKPLEQQGGAIIEVNSSPGLLAHLKPATGKPRNVGANIVAHLFAPEESARIPIIGVAGTNETSLTARLIAGIVNMTGKYTGVACKDGIYMDQRLVAKGDCSHWDAGQRLLINRNIETAIFETNPRAILRDGLVYDRCLVGVVTDLDGYQDLTDFYIDDSEQMFKVMRSQIDVILPEGCAVIHAAIPQAQELAQLCDGKVIYYGLDGNCELMKKHRQQGHKALFLREDNIILGMENDEINLLQLSSLKPEKATKPLSIMAAIAATWALNIPIDAITAAIRNFDSNAITKNY